MSAVVGTAYSESFALPSGATGQTFTRSASYVAGVATTWNPTFSEIGAGAYRYAYTPAAAGLHEWVGTAGDGSVLVLNVQAVTASQADPVASLIAQNLTVDAPSSTVADRTLAIGADTAFEWSSTGWDDLTGDTATFQATKTITDTDVFPVALSVTVGSAGQSTQTLSVTLDADDTALFAEGVQYGYAVTAANAGPLVSGALSAREG